MRTDIRFFAALGLLLAGLSIPAAAQRPRNDGFCRRDGQMHVLRNGLLRPLLRDARLPTGTLVTTAGFLIARNGERTELTEGQGCDLQGRVVAVEPAPGGSLALGKTAAPSAPPTAAPPAPAAVGTPTHQPDPEPPRDDDDARNQRDEQGNDEDAKKRGEQAWEQRKRDEEQQREAAKRREEEEREARKEEKEQRKKRRKWDD